MSMNPSLSTSATEVEVVTMISPGRVASEKVRPPALPNRTWFSWLRLLSTMSKNPSLSTSATAVD